MTIRLRHLPTSARGSFYTMAWAMRATRDISGWSARHRTVHDAYITGAGVKLDSWVPTTVTRLRPHLPVPELASHGQWEFPRQPRATASSSAARDAASLLTGQLTSGLSIRASRLGQ
jgi:hypothetical protein